VEPADEDETTGTLHWYVYDAWNRLIEVWQDDGDGSQEITGQTPDDTQIAAYEYDPASRSRYVGAGRLHRRIQKTDKTGESDVTYDYYYNTAWQVLSRKKV
jgi:YD repeat-containing protein